MTLETDLTQFTGTARVYGIIFVTATAKDGKADLVALRDKGLPPLWQRHIDFTDLPTGEWPLWMADGGPEGALVIMLPTEY